MKEFTEVYTRPKHFFIGLVIVLEHKGRPFKMCIFVRQKLGHTIRLLIILDLQLWFDEFFDVRTFQIEFHVQFFLFIFQIVGRLFVILQFL